MFVSIVLSDVQMNSSRLISRFGGHLGSVFNQARFVQLLLCPITSIPTTAVPLSRFSKMVNDSQVCLRFARLSDKAHVPVKGSAKAAGFDLKSAYDYVIPAHGKEIVKTDIQVQLPEGCYGRVAPRSGLAAKNFIDVGAGVIDEDYRGNVGVVLFNHSDKDFEVKSGDRVAQLICERIFYPTLVEEKSLDKTPRGEGGFGSTGTN